MAKAERSGKNPVVGGEDQASRVALVRSGWDRGREFKRKRYLDENMRKSKASEPVFAVCMNNEHYPTSLELHKIYRVIPDENAAKDGDIRVVDESGEDYLYRAKDFVVIDLPAEVRGALLEAS